MKNVTRNLLLSATLMAVVGLCVASGYGGYRGGRFYQRHFVDQPAAIAAEAGHYDSKTAEFAFGPADGPSQEQLANLAASFLAPAPTARPTHKPVH